MISLSHDITSFFFIREITQRGKNYMGFFENATYLEIIK